MYHISSPSSIIIHQSGLPQRVYLKTFPKSLNVARTWENHVPSIFNTLEPGNQNHPKKTWESPNNPIPLRYYIADITLYSYLPLRSLATPFQHLLKRNYLDDTWPPVVWGSMFPQNSCSKIMDVPYQYPHGVFILAIIWLTCAYILPRISSNGLDFSYCQATPLAWVWWERCFALAPDSQHGKNILQPGRNPSTATPPPRYQRGRWDVKLLGLAFFVQSQACRWQSPVYSLAHCNASEMTRCYDPLKKGCMD